MFGITTAVYGLVDIHPRDLSQWPKDERCQWLFYWLSYGHFPKEYCQFASWFILLKYLNPNFINILVVMGGRGEGEKPPQSSAERAAKCGEKIQKLRERGIFSLLRLSEPNFVGRLGALYPVVFWIWDCALHFKATSIWSILLLYLCVVLLLIQYRLSISLRSVSLLLCDTSSDPLDHHRIISN